jgi:hypothetical protein
MAENVLSDVCEGEKNWSTSRPEGKKMRLATVGAMRKPIARQCCEVDT